MWLYLDPGCAQFKFITICVPRCMPTILLVHNKRVLVSYQQFQIFFKMCLMLVGQDPVIFSSHSFRRGGVTWTFISEVPGEQVKVHGDWTSDAY